MSSDTVHFNTAGGGTPTAPGRFVDVPSIDPVELVPGLEFRPVLGESTMANFVSFGPHVEAPKHCHVEEQTVIVLQGELMFDIDGEVKKLLPGDVAVIPPWVPHGAWTEDIPCVEVDVFNPPRATLLEHARSQRREP